MVADEEGQGERLRVLYPDGIVPDPYRVGRDVVLTGSLNANGVFEADEDSLITKCPSKFSDEVADDTNVEFVD
jgi:cytochrome c-type biogenesis protein CcmE